MTILGTKPWEDDFCEHLLGMPRIRGATRHSLNPFGDIVDCHQNVLAVAGLRERSHEVYTPNIEYLNLQVVCDGHCIVSSDSS